LRVCRPSASFSGSIAASRGPSARQLQQDAVDRWICVQALDGGQNLGSRGGGAEVVAKGADADAPAGLLLVGHIDAAGGVVADAQHRQTRGAGGAGPPGLDHRRESGLDRRRQTTTVEKRCHGRTFADSSMKVGRIVNLAV
jgi:hypothetical protein